MSLLPTIEQITRVEGSKMFRWMIAIVVASFLFIAGSVSFADDWPWWRGPRHDGISKETGWLDVWPKEGPPLRWRRNVGVGFSTVAVSNGRLFTLGHHDGKDTVYCFDALSGKTIWSH